MNTSSFRVVPRVPLMTSSFVSPVIHFPVLASDLDPSLITRRINAHPLRGFFYADSSLKFNSFSFSPIENQCTPSSEGVFYAHSSLKVRFILFLLYRRIISPSSEGFLRAFFSEGQIHSLSPLSENQCSPLFGGGFLRAFFSEGQIHSLSPSIGESMLTPFRRGFLRAFFSEGQIHSLSPLSENQCSHPPCSYLPDCQVFICTETNLRISFISF